MATYIPQNFAMIAGDEMSANNNIPVAFGYYAETEVPGDILTAPPNGVDFFGLRRSPAALAANPLTPAEKLLPSASLLLPRGTIILINGKDNGAPANLPWVLYVVITSDAGEDTAYNIVYGFNV